MKRKIFNKYSIFILFIIVNFIIVIILANITSKDSKMEDDFTGGEFVPEMFVYVSGDKGWIQEVNFRGKYSVSLGQLLTTTIEKNVVNAIKSDLGLVVDKNNWPKDGIKLEIENIELIGNSYQTNAVEFYVVVPDFNKRYHTSINLEKDPNEISIKSAT